MVFFLGFLLGIAFDWYENKFIVLDVVRRPFALSTPIRQVALFLIRLVVTYGCLVGLFFVYGFWLTVAAFVGYWVFSWTTFRTYFGREVQRVAKVLMESEPGDDPDDRISLAEAFEHATRIVTGNMKTAGRGSVF